MPGHGVIKGTWQRVGFFIFIIQILTGPPKDINFFNFLVGFMFKSVELFESANRHPVVNVYGVSRKFPEVR